MNDSSHTKKCSNPNDHLLVVLVLLSNFIGRGKVRDGVLNSLYYLFCFVFSTQTGPGARRTNVNTFNGPYNDSVLHLLYFTIFDSFSFQKSSIKNIFFNMRKER